MSEFNERPPFGVKPQWFVKEERLCDLEDAIKRYKDAGMLVPEEWERERKDIHQWFKFRNIKQVDLSMSNEISGYLSLIEWLREKIEESMKNVGISVDRMGKSPDQPAVGENICNCTGEEHDQKCTYFPKSQPKSVPLTIKEGVNYFPDQKEQPKKRIEVKGIGYSYEQSKGQNAEVYVMYLSKMTFLSDNQIKDVAKAIEAVLNDEEGGNLGEFQIFVPKGSCEVIRKYTQAETDKMCEDAFNAGRVRSEKLIGSFFKFQTFNDYKNSKTSQL